MACVLLKGSARLLQLCCEARQTCLCGEASPPNVDVEDNELGVLVTRVFTNLIFPFHIFYIIRIIYSTFSICISAYLIDADPTSVLAKVQWGRS